VSQADIYVYSLCPKFHYHYNQYWHIFSKNAILGLCGGRRYSHCSFCNGIAWDIIRRSGVSRAVVKSPDGKPSRINSMLVYFMLFPEENVRILPINFKTIPQAIIDCNTHQKINTLSFLKSVIWSYVIIKIKLYLSVPTNEVITILLQNPESLQYVIFG